MLKAILLFIKTHTVATAITTTVVVGAAVSTPIVVDNHKLNSSIEANIGMLTQSDNSEISNNSATNDNEPLTFRIEKVVTENDGIAWEEDENGKRTYIDARNKYDI